MLVSFLRIFAWITLVLGLLGTVSAAIDFDADAEFVAMVLYGSLAGPLFFFALAAIIEHLQWLSAPLRERERDREEVLP